MKKFLPILFLFITVPIYAEFGIGTGLDLTMGINNLESDIANIQYFNYPVLPTNANVNLFYFNSKQSKMGLLLDFDFQYSWVDSYKTVEYKGNDNHHIVPENILFEKGNDDLWYKSEKIDPTSSFEIVLSPKFAFRVNDWLFGIGPTYTYSFAKMLFSDEANRLDFTNGTYGYSERTVEFVNRQYIGANIAAKYKYFIIRTGIDFLEKSWFTNNTFKNCFNYNLSIGFRKDWKFNTIKDRKQEELDILLHQKEEQRIEQENEERQKKELELELEKKKKDEEDKRQAEIKAELEQQEKEKIKQQNLKYAEDILNAFSYSKIPFGKNMDEIIALCKDKNVAIEENDRTDVFFIRDYNLSLFKGSLYSHALTTLGCYLLGDCTKSYTIKSEYWENLKSITLIFTKSYSKSDFTLMMVVKEQKRTDDLLEGKYQSVYNVMKNSISKQVGLKSFDFEETYINDYLKKCYALCSKWQLSDKQIYLFVDNSSVLHESSRGPIIVYADDLQCQKYINTEKKYAQENKKKEEEKIKIDF